MIFSRGLSRARAIPPGETEVVLDISRLLSRAYHTTPTGIDRVEFYYARHLLDRIPDRLSFAAVHPAGGFYGRLSTAAVRQFLTFTDARWYNRDILPLDKVRSAAVRHLFALRPRTVPRATGPRILLQSSPHHLEDRNLVEAILRSERAEFVTLVHDVIPLTHPEFARPNGRAIQLDRMKTIDLHASGIIGNSQATLDAIRPLLKSRRRDRVQRVAHLGADLGDAPRRGPSPYAGRRYFVFVSTIEPRKNHLLLLNIWREFTNLRPDARPLLVIIGRRGWENENAIDMIERCRALAGNIIEESDVSDRDLQSLLAGARAVLLPSFAEGFGMPVAEALALGVPVIASDIPALREVGREVPEYIDPIDGVGWRDTILDYAADDSPRRAAQLQRLKGWRPTRWSGHIDIVLDVLDEVAANAASGISGRRGEL